MTAWILFGYLTGLFAVVGLAIAHPGTRPYTGGSYLSRRVQMLFQYWLGVAIMAIIWPLLVIYIGVTELIRELT